VVRVLVDSARSREILVYYSLSAALIEVSSMPAFERHALPRYPLPCVRMGRLGCSAVHPGQGLRRALVRLEVRRCIEDQAHLAAYALIVDAKSEDARTFYKHYGSIEMVDSPVSLYLPLAAARKTKVA
jgi:hypothetical protein